MQHSCYVFGIGGGDNAITKHLEYFAIRYILVELMNLEINQTAIASITEERLNQSQLLLFTSPTAINAASTIFSLINQNAIDIAVVGDASATLMKKYTSKKIICPTKSGVEELFNLEQLKNYKKIMILGGDIANKIKYDSYGKIFDFVDLYYYSLQTKSLDDLNFKIIKSLIFTSSLVLKEFVKSNNSKESLDYFLLHQNMRHLIKSARRIYIADSPTMESLATIVEEKSHG